MPVNVAYQQSSLTSLSSYHRSPITAMLQAAVKYQGRLLPWGYRGRQHAIAEPIRPTGYWAEAGGGGPAEASRI